MCLIAYVPGNMELPENHFRSAAKDNDDGIGFMSQEGVEKFLGRKMVKRAWRYAKELHDAGIEYAVHFRWATHGIVALRNCHPFKTPDGNAYVMHNGILTAYTPTNKHGDASDTSLFVDTLIGVDIADADYWQKVALHIGWGNKLCVMSHDAQFRIVNADAGDWIDGVWYSQTYSLPGYGYDTRSWTYKADEQGSAWLGHNTANYGGYGHLVEAALERRYGADGKTMSLVAASATDTGTNGSGTHSVEADAYYRTPEPQHCGAYHDHDDAELDKALAEHLADDEDEETADDGPDTICPSCEHIYSSFEADSWNEDGMLRCPECGFIDMSDGMLDGYHGVAAK